MVVDSYHSSLKKGDLKDLKKYIYALKRDASWVGNDGLSPLHLAARYNQVGVCQVLLEEGITPDVTEPFTQKTALHIAAYFGHHEVAKVLKKFGATLDLEDCLSCTPLHYAAMGEKKEMLLFFLENRINPSEQSIFGNALDILIRKKNLSLVDFISNIGGVLALDPDSFQEDTPDRLMKDSLWTPFHSAAVSGQTEIFEMLARKFPFLSALKERLASARPRECTSVADLAVLEEVLSIKKILKIEQATEEYRKVFMKKNRYETNRPERKELCESIRYRDIEKIKDIVRDQGSEVFFKRDEKTGVERYFQSLENPNALDFASYVYSLPFFDVLIENKVNIPLEEFLVSNRIGCLFFHWACMEVHPLGEGFMNHIGKKDGNGKNLS